MLSHLAPSNSSHAEGCELWHAILKSCAMASKKGAKETDTKIEFAVQDFVFEDPTDPDIWTLAGPVLASKILACAKEIMVHQYGAAFFKYLWVEGDINAGEVIYKHCSEDEGKKSKVYPKLLFRIVANKVVKLDVVDRGPPWKVLVSNPITGVEIDTLDMAPDLSWKEAVHKLRAAANVPKNSGLVVLDNKGAIIELRGNTVMKNVSEMPASTPSTSSKRLKAMVLG